MAFGVKYRMNFQDEVGIEWEADILQEGYVGGISTIKGDTSFPITLEMEGFDHPFEPICHTNAIVKIMSEVLDEWIEFQTADVFEYALDLKRAGTTYWKGVLVTETYEEDYTTEPYGVQLTFNDGLSELQFERYDNAGVVRSDFATCIDILVNCIAELPSFLARPYREMINIFEDNMNDADTEGLLEQLFIFEGAFWELDDDDIIKGMDCLSVIKGIMVSLGCRIIVSQDKWYIQRIGELLKTSAIKLVDYDSSGTVTGNSTLDLRHPITDRTASLPALLVPIENDGRNAFNREYQEVTFSYTSRNLTTLDNTVFINGNFDKGYEIQAGAPVPLHWFRSTAVNNQLAVDSTSMHMGIVNGQPASLIIEDAMLVNVKINTIPFAISNVLQVDATHETFSLIPESPADPLVTYKNLLTDTSDNLQIRFSGHFDYEYNNVNLLNAQVPGMFMKWTIQLGSNFYNSSNKSWDATATNRVWTVESGSYWDDVILVQTTTELIKRHTFDRVINIANFPADSTDDLIVTWFIPETYRAPSLFNTIEVISRIDITFETMTIAYISSDSTEFSIQKVLGSTGSTTLRTNRFAVEVVHGDGPSSFSINSFRLPTTNLPTNTWSTRGGSEALPGFKILIINPIFENLGDYRQVWSGSLRGFLELHETITDIDSKQFIIKGYGFNVLAAIHNLVLHEVGALSPSVTFVIQFDLPTLIPIPDGDAGIGHHGENVLDSSETTNQGMGLINISGMSAAVTAVIRSNNDSNDTGGDYPL